MTLDHLDPATVRENHATSVDLYPGAHMVVADDGVYLAEVVMSGVLGRPLRADERVAHRNGDTRDMRKSNLYLTTL